MTRPAPLSSNPSYTPLVSAAATMLLRKAARAPKDSREGMFVRGRRTQLRDEVKACDYCMRKRLCGLPRGFAAEGPTPALLTIVVDQPTREDVEIRNRPPGLYDRETSPGIVLDRMLGGIGMTREDIYLHPAAACPEFNRLGQVYTKGDTLAMAMAEDDRVSPHTVSGEHCIALYAERSLRLSKARVVLVLGEGGLGVAKQAKGFAAGVPLAKAVRFAPPLSAGVTWVAGWGIPESITNSQRLADLHETFATVGELVQQDVERFAHETFPGSMVVGSVTYAQAVDEVFRVLAPALKGLPPARHRHRMLRLLEELVDVVSESPSTAHNAACAVRLLREFKSGEVVFPNTGHLAKKGE